MRLWTLHPSLLDKQGLLALWREALLAQKVLRGQTKGYKKHPQLERFRAQEEPLLAIADYLFIIYHVAVERGYNFDYNKIYERPTGWYHRKISVTDEQAVFECGHLIRKLTKRKSIGKLQEIIEMLNEDNIIIHPLFHMVDGPVEAWEKGSLRKKKGAKNE